MYSMWEQIASVLEQRERAFVNWEERFFICPHCKQIVYEDEMVDDPICPSCGVVLM